MMMMVRNNQCSLHKVTTTLKIVTTVVKDVDSCFNEQQQQQKQPKNENVGKFISQFCMVGIVASLLFLLDSSSFTTTTTDSTFLGWVVGVQALSTRTIPTTTRTRGILLVRETTNLKYHNIYDNNNNDCSTRMMITTEPRKRNVQLFLPSTTLNAQSSNDNESETNKDSTTSFDLTTTSSSTSNTQQQQQPSAAATTTNDNLKNDENDNNSNVINTEPDYPLNVPSPILLAGSMLFGIASTGKNEGRGVPALPSCSGFVSFS